jgi:Uma2 family endonuclease
MEDLISRPPRTIMEVYRMLPEGTLAELIDGNIYMSPSPITPHQRTIGRLFTRMASFVEENDLGEVFIAPYDVYLDEENNAVQPDIIFVAKKNLSIIRDHIHGIPDLLVEVLSPGNMNHDTLRKKNLYERFGVKEYWIVDPKTRESIGYHLEDGKYREFFRSIGAIQSELLNNDFKF